MKKYYYLFGEGSVVNQVICAILINLPVFAYGNCIGWMSPMTLLLQSPESPTEVPLSDSLVSWMAAVAYLVCVPMNFFVAIMGDKLGRKVTLLFISASCVACWVIKLCSLSPWALILARALVGVAMAGAYVTCPLYTKEISSDAIRGALGSLVILFHTSGNLFMYVIGDILQYRPILWIGLSIPTIHIVLFMMMPESPSFLVKNGKLEEARKVLAWLRCRDEDDMKISQEIDFMQKEQAQDAESSKFVLKAILQDKLLIRAFKIAMIASLSREACGAVPVLNFAADIFSMSSEGSGLTLTPNQQAMALGAVQLAGSTVASSLVEKAGRKPLLFISSFISGLSMTALASWFLLKDYSILAPAWIPIAMLCICIFCDSAGLCSMAVVITTEIFSFKYRGTVIATTMATASLVDCFQLLFFKSLARAIGVHVAFYAFGVICLMAALYIFLVFPETRNRSLKEIYNDLKTKKEKELEMKEKELEIKGKELEVKV